jgi:hypothetical protein
LDFFFHLAMNFVLSSEFRDLTDTAIC